MATLTSTHNSWAKPQTAQYNNNIWTKWLNFTDGQKKNQTFWFLFALVFQGVLFLPIPAALSFYYGAPEILLGVTLVLFFATIIAGMGGMGIRVLLSLFAFNTLAHMVMLLVYIL